MNNYCCACGAYLKAPPQPFTIFKLPTSLSLCTILFIHCQSHHHLHSALLLAPHRPNFKFAPSTQPQFFILHYSFFIIHSHSSPATPPSPPTPHYPSPRTTPILHFSFIKAPPSPLSPSFLSAPFSHFSTASCCCRAHCSPTACSLSFSCRPLSSPRFS